MDNAEQRRVRRERMRQRMEQRRMANHEGVAVPVPVPDTTEMQPPSIDPQAPIVMHEGKLQEAANEYKQQLAMRIERTKEFLYSAAAAEVQAAPQTVEEYREIALETERIVNGYQPSAEWRRDLKLNYDAIRRLWREHRERDDGKAEFVDPKHNEKEALRVQWLHAHEESTPSMPPPPFPLEMIDTTDRSKMIKLCKCHKIPIEPTRQHDKVVYYQPLMYRCKHHSNMKLFSADIAQLLACAAESTQKQERLARGRAMGQRIGWAINLIVREEREAEERIKGGSTELMPLHQPMDALMLQRAHPTLFGCPPPEYFARDVAAMQQWSTSCTPDSDSYALALTHQRVIRAAEARGINFLRLDGLSEQQRLELFTTPYLQLPPAAASESEAPVSAPGEFVPQQIGAWMPAVDETTPAAQSAVSKGVPMDEFISGVTDEPRLRGTEAAIVVSEDVASERSTDSSQMMNVDSSYSS